MRIRLLMAASAAALTAGTAQAETVLHILHTNDFHSRVESINAYDSTCDAETEGKGECFGGTARFVTKINELRKQFEDAGEPMILLDAGDQFQGSLFYTTYKGKDTAEFMNKLGYDAMAVGNHEFDDGPEVLASFMDAAEFPVISANIDASQDAALKDRLVGNTIIEIGNHKIGVIGGTTLDTPEIASPGDDVIFLDDVESIKADVQELTEQGVDKIIALTHEGYNRDQELAAAVPGLDAVVGGHTHSPLGTMENAVGPYPTLVAGADGVDVPVVQAYAYSKYLGHLKLTFDDAGKVIAVEGEPILMDASVTPDPETLTRIAELGAPIEELKNKQVGEIAAPIDGDRANCRAKECEMGNVVSEAMLARVKDQGITIALSNGGGLRASIDAGPVTMGEVLTVLPFQNTLSTFQVTGADVVAALENGASQLEEGGGRFVQVAGLKYTINSAAEPGSRISDVLVSKDGEWMPIDPSATYGVVSNNYVRGGGDGFEVFATNAKNVYDFGPDLADVLAEYIAGQGPDFAPVLDGRITVN
ncbi:multifunctional 2',3'-cyclic-nucleotide 2'-phosphodiesterase/5'-nucleotidase/3'-nucleotidase [Paracoccus sp. M683]|uniref:bifunctional metallophosphatase/5'-nucleotidase n=1 Tax=Paracoccus sp. M683 TaxID=2594268 RepID=UPI00117E7C4F|nr:bifunctional metallophosphatase/5'-nucleotidase [Paracoccus sp. M683]TRW96882.1 multifunctional 2',3'-cyclic-nucleotide 2'-phosphodiesterase/5'-nucleotidase/3'-nucleotidase [Paracoccus sp. M683]